MDPTRTKPVLASGQLTEDWTDYVLEARVMLVHEVDDRCEPVAVPITFGEWIDEGIADRRATLSDLEYHCTTLFPPVRPRGWLEVRWLDCLPAGVAEVASAAIAALLIDEDSADEALEACAGVDRRASWATTASLGTQDRELAAAGGWLLTVAARALDRSAAPARWAESVADAAERWPAKGRSPADDLEEKLAGGATVLDLADPPHEVFP
jgi:glutamate--cysteine ligase